MRDSTIFYASFYEAIIDLPQHNQIEVYNAIFELSLKGKDIELTGISKTIFTLIRPQIIANLARYENGKKGAEHGKKGGRPLKKKPLDNPKISPNETPNKNNNVNVNNNLNNNINDIYKYWNEKTNHNLKGDSSIIKNLTIILKSYTYEDVIKVIDFIVESKWHQEKGQVLLSVVSRPNKFSERLDKALNSHPKQDPLFRCNNNDFSEVF